MTRSVFATAIQQWATAALLLVVPVVHGAPPPQFLESHAACLVTDAAVVPLQLEHASTTEQRRFGLMERTELAANAGMLFLYPSQRSAGSGFWMYRTRLPLDIAWLDEAGVILAVDTMTPCESGTPADCPSWSPGVPHRHVLEMNADFFAEHHVAVGDRVIVNLNDHNPCLGAD